MLKRKKEWRSCYVFRMWCVRKERSCGKLGWNKLCALKPMMYTCRIFQYWTGLTRSPIVHSMKLIFCYWIHPGTHFVRIAIIYHLFLWFINWKQDNTELHSYPVLSLLELLTCFLKQVFKHWKYELWRFLCKTIQTIQERVSVS